MQNQETKRKIFTLMIASLMTSCSCSSFMDTAQTDAAIRMVDEQNYVFIAEYALPLPGGSIYLSSNYTFEVSKDSIISYLPYFGRAYFSTHRLGEGGIQFQSKNFDYKSTPQKNGREITISTKDVRRRYQILLSVFSDGNATLTAISPDRQLISFNGYIEERN